jgi:hypothetical protein
VHDREPHPSDRLPAEEEGAAGADSGLARLLGSAIGFWAAVFVIVWVAIEIA